MILSVLTIKKNNLPLVISNWVSLTCNMNCIWMILIVFYTPQKKKNDGKNKNY